VSSANASWGANQNLPGTLYTFVASTSPDLNPPASSMTTTALAGAVPGLVPNTTYYFGVDAANAAGTSAFAPLGASVTLAATPASLDAGAFTAVFYSSLTVSWAAIPTRRARPTTWR